MSSKFKKIEQGTARADITRLFELAKKSASKEPALAKRYVTLARKLASKSRISLRAYNRLHCRKCNTYFTSKTLRVRTRIASVVYACLSCGHITRIRKK